MGEKLRPIITFLIQSVLNDHLSSHDINELKDNLSSNSVTQARNLNLAFLSLLGSGKEQDRHELKRTFHRLRQSPEWKDAVEFYLKGIDLVFKETNTICQRDKGFSGHMDNLNEWIRDQNPNDKNPELASRFWSVFFPEANGLLDRREEAIGRLREKRKVEISNLNNNPIDNPGAQILFSSNVLLTIPPESKPIKELSMNKNLRNSIEKIRSEPQIYWYDHPVHLGVEQEKNEIIYGLNGLANAFEYEKERGVLSREVDPTCVLSVSVTHKGLHNMVREYLQDTLVGAGKLKNLNLFVFTEGDTKRIIQEVIAPAAEHYFHEDEAGMKLAHFGVDGEYGRHYTFLKAIAPFWKILINPEIKATFKIDLDQVFPQEELVSQTGLSALEHLKTPLWGAEGVDASGQPVELGLIAGALVNEKDIHESLFVPDVRFPERPLSPDEYIFFSALPQAISTEAEMMTRYDSKPLDGKTSCLQRVHVTGGTNGILVEHLLKQRPFTPSFIGRAEDQAYILSVLSNKGPRLAYAHQDGLIMRHDKEAFAQEAIQRAHASKLVGDFIRVLVFSAYSSIISKDIMTVKELLDPFTGGFISKIPLTLTYLRFAFKAASFFEQGDKKNGLEFVTNGSKRITESIAFISDKRLQRQYEAEREGWYLYYDCLLALEKGLRDGDPLAEDLKAKAREIVDQCHIRPAPKAGW